MFKRTTPQLQNYAASKHLRRVTQFVKKSVWLSRMMRWSLRQYQAITGTAPDVLRELKSVDKAPPSPANAEQRVLIFTLRGWFAHLAWETTIARALHLRGADTLTIICDEILPACEQRTLVDDFASACDLCYYRSRTFLKRTGLPFSRLSKYIHADDMQRSAAQVANLSLQELREFSVDGLPMGKLVEASVLRHIFEGTVANTPENTEIYRRFVQAALIVQQVSYRLLDEFRPTSIIVLNGLFYAEAILMEIANQRDIPVWTYERDKRVDALILARDISVLRLRYVEPWARRSQMPLNEVENAQLDDYLASRRQGNVGVQILWDRMDKADGVSADQKLAVLFTNVLWDTAVYEADVGFDSMIHWLQHTIAWFADHPDYKLAIRIHPAEVRIPFKESLSPVMDYLPEIPANVQVIGPYEKIDSYALVDMAKLVLVYTSTIGLESVLFDTPIIVAGQTHYRDKGLSSDPKTIEEFDRNLEALLAEPKPIPEQVELARRYAYMYFFEEIIPFPFVREEPAAYASLSYRKNEVLAPGASSYMDTICDAILLQKQPTNPQPAKTNLL